MCDLCLAGINHFKTSQRVSSHHDRLLLHCVHSYFLQVHLSYLFCSTCWLTVIKLFCTSNFAPSTRDMGVQGANRHISGIWTHCALKSFNGALISRTKTTCQTAAMRKVNFLHLSLFLKVLVEICCFWFFYFVEICCFFVVVYLLYSNIIPELPILYSFFSFIVIM